MGDQNSILSRAEARHLVRRACFGALPHEIDRYEGLTRGEAADRIVRSPSRAFRPGGRDFDKQHDRWVKYMISSSVPLQGKLVLFWHDHFATGFSKVQDTKRMGRQIQLLHRMCKGSFRDLVKEMNRDAAMMDWLDTVRNHKEVPNENYARELQELFTLGVYDSAGNATYTQDDIVQIARAFTGWGSDERGNAFLDDGDHDFTDDFPERGAKVIFRSTGGFGSGGADFTANGEGAAEIDTVVDIIFAHRDSQGRNTVARRTARRLLEYFAHPSPSLAVIDQVVADSGFDSSWDVSALLQAIFVNDAFYASAAPAPYGASAKKSIKWPVDYVVGTVRMLGMKLRGREQAVAGGSGARVLDQLADMGQVVLDPPSVFGWDWETDWLSSSTLLARYRFGRDVSAARDGGGAQAFRPERLIDVTLTDPGAIVDAVTDHLGVDDQLTASDRNVLIDYLTDGGANPTIDLSDPDVRNRKLGGLFALVLQSPAYQLH